MSTVSTSFTIGYSVRETVTSNDIGIEYGVRSRVTKSYSVKYGVRKTIYPAKVFSLKHSVRRRVLKNFGIQYGVRVSIAGPGDGGAFSDAFSADFDSNAGSGGSPGKTVALIYSVRSEVDKSISVQYDVAAVAESTVSKSFSISYHTLVTPEVDEVITKSIAVDAVPPQVITTSSL